jgi:hypothetical protein
MQIIRGTITDKQSQQILIGVKVCVVESNPMNCVQSDTKGIYRIQKLKPGRYDLKFSYLGYKEVTIPNVIGLTQEQFAQDHRDYVWQLMETPPLQQRALAIEHT